MGGGDLNFKKSWHPATFKNQERVWKAEQQAIEEQKKAEQLRREIEEQRQMEDLHRLQEQAGSRKASNKMDWMYGMGPESSTAISEEKEQFLLGKRKVDKLLESKIEEKATLSSGQIIKDDKVGSELDNLSKFRDDPLTAILMKQKADIEKMLKNPMKRKEIEHSKDKKHKKDKKEKREKRDRRDREERDDKYMYKEERSDTNKSYDRDMDKDRDYSSHRRSRDHEHRGRNSRSERPSARSPSYKNDHQYSRPSHIHRGYSPDNRRIYDRHHRDSRYEHRDSQRNDCSFRRRDRSRSNERNRSQADPKREELEREERERKLRAMMQNADEMGVERKERLSRIELREREEAENNLEEQIRTSKGGHSASFIKQMHHDHYYSRR